MKSPELFREYIWLVKTIYDAGRISFDEINEKWLQTEMSGGMSISKTTFRRHIDAILDMFGIVIECERRGGYKYYIYNRRVLEENTIQNWMLNTISVSNIISEGISIQSRILLEKAPAGNRYLQLVINAMKDGKRLFIKYKRYGHEFAKEHVIEPYCLKMFNKRWYVLAHWHDDVFGVLSFDRIEEMEITNETFVIDPDFDAEFFFSECYGVIQGDGTEPYDVVLRVYNRSISYLKDLPLHHSQTILKETAKYTDFGYYIRPTYDLTLAILGFGPDVEVLKPVWFRREIIENLDLALRRYQ